MKDLFDVIKGLQRRLEELEKKGSNFTTWIVPTFLNGWTNYDTTYNPCGYFKDATGMVHLRGLVKNGTMGQAIFQLPIGYRPEFRMLLVINTNTGIGRVDVSTDGVVWAMAGGNGWVSLDGLGFRAL